MWLEYGLSSAQGLVHISEVVRGRTALACPYCACSLIAKKGQRVSHHFAHDGATCKPVRRTRDLPTLPWFDSFTLHLAPHLLAMLQAFHAGRSYDVHGLESADLIRYNGFSYAYELTKRGQIPLGLLSVNLFSRLHEERLAILHDQLDQRVSWAWKAGNSVALDEVLTDLRLYRAQWQRVLRRSLYCLAIETTSERFYKIGVTARPIAERVSELQNALSPHVGEVTITVLGVWPHRGHVERYAHFRHQAQRRTLGTFQEYFDFPDVKAVVRDFNRMPKKVLTALEQDVLEGAPSVVMQAMAAEQAAQDRRIKRDQRGAQIKAGMVAAQQTGTHVGRPKGSRQANAVLLAKPSSQAIVQCLNAGMSLRETAAVGVAVNTVRKVRTALAEDWSNNQE